MEEDRSDSVGDRLARIETKLDNSLTQNADHEKRIRFLERLGWLAVALVTGSLGIQLNDVAQLGG